MKCEDCVSFPKDCDLLIQDHVWGRGEHRGCEFWRGAVGGKTREEIMRRLHRKVKEGQDINVE